MNTMWTIMRAMCGYQTTEAASIQPIALPLSVSHPKLLKKT